MNTKWKIIISVMAINLIFSACFTAVFISDSNNNLEEFTTLYAEGVSGIVSTIQEQASRQYRQRIQSFLQYNANQDKMRMIKAFNERDKKELIRLTTPYFELFQKENPNFATLTWLLPNNTSYLHMHDTNKPGRDVSMHRPDIVSTNKERQQYAGFSASTVGMQYRIVNPVTFEGQHIGVLHFGLKMDLFIEAIQNKLHLPVGVVISKKDYKRIINKDLYIAGPSFAIQSSQIELFKKDFANIDWTLEKQRVILHDKDYIVLKAISLDNYLQESQGYIFVALDISKQVAKARSDILFILILSAALLLLSFLVLYFSYDSFSKRLENLQIVEKINSALEARVTARTNELRQSERKFRVLVENNPYGIQEIDCSGKLLFANKKCHQMLGYEGQSLIGESVIDTQTPPLRDELPEYLKMLIKDKPLPTTYCCTVLTRQGEERNIEVAWNYQQDTEENVTGFISVLTDVTESKKAEEELKEYREHLERLVEKRTSELKEKTDRIEESRKSLTYLVENMNETRKELEKANTDYAEANKELKEFAYIVSHDLKAPLRAISQLTHWISQDYSHVFDDDGKLQMDLVIKRVKRMDGLIDGILRYSQVGRIREKEESLDLNLLTNEVIDNLAAPDHVNIIIEDKLPVVVRDSIRMEQVLQNLIGNAIKFMDKDEGIIKVRCSDEGSSWKFSISDNGPGIDKRYHDKIFQIFQTLTARDEHESTGIGLTLVKKIIRLYGGSVWVESQTDQGSTFFFTLPKKGEKHEKL